VAKKKNADTNNTEKKLESLDVVRKAIEKKFGIVPHTLGQRGELKLDIISSGCISLDVALGVGGFSKGRIYEIYGIPSGGKTTLAMSVIAEAQKKGQAAVFVDAEHSADPILFKAMGVNVDKLELIELYTGDDNLDALELYLRSKHFDVAVVDSVSALIPKNEAESEMGNQFMGLHARLMSKALRKLAPVVSENNTLLIFINQIRYKIVPYGDPTTTTGGEALNFYSTGRIQVSGGESKKTRIEDSQGQVIGHHTSFKIHKNKLAPPHREATVPLIYGVGYDRHWECLKFATELGIIEKKGAYYYYTDDKAFASGEHNAIEYLKENENVYSEIRSKIIDMVGLSGVYE
jgi:recombination protein RecA